MLNPTRDQNQPVQKRLSRWLLRGPRVALGLILSYSSLSVAGEFQAEVEYQACFTPYQNCTADIVGLVNRAKNSIFMQAYSFTSRSIAKALVRAKKRGVTVKIIFDKSNFTGEVYSLAKYVIHAGIPAWNDNLLNIAHNKVMVIDESIVETGSFNYTFAAQKHNAENVLIIHDKTLAKEYLVNWYRREKASARVP